MNIKINTQMKEISDNIIISNSLVNTLNKNSDPWYIKDVNLKYIYANSTYRNLIGNVNPVGYFERGINSIFKKYAYLIEQHEIDVIVKLKRISSIGYFLAENNKKSKLLYCDKIPMIDENKICIGIISHIRELIYFNSLDYFNHSPLLPIYTQAPYIPLTEREWKVLFLFCRGIPNKSISIEVGISDKTLEKIIYIIYDKLMVVSSLDLRILCRKNHYDLYIPNCYLNSLNYIIL